MITLPQIKSAFDNNPIVELLSWEEKGDKFELRINFLICKTINSKLLNIDKLVAVTIATSYPNILPVVSEYEEKTIVNYSHLYPDGTFCRGTDFDLRYKLEVNNYDLRDFLEVIAWYLITWEYLNETGEYLIGERSHGVNGTLETYAEVLNLKNIRALYPLSRNGYLTSSNKINNKPCFCGSGRKFKQCHQQVVKQFVKRPLMKAEFIKDMKRLGVINDTL